MQWQIARRRCDSYRRDVDSRRDCATARWLVAPPPSPLQDAVHNSMLWHQNENATFLAERLVAEERTEETLHLLATTHFRANKPSYAYSILKGLTSQVRMPRASVCCAHVVQCCNSAFLHRTRIPMVLIHLHHSLAHPPPSHSPLQACRYLFARCCLALDR